MTSTVELIELKRAIQVSVSRLLAPGCFVLNHLLKGVHLSIPLGLELGHLEFTVHIRD